jgi:hypothetical protein
MTIRGSIIIRPPGCGFGSINAELWIRFRILTIYQRFEKFQKKVYILSFSTIYNLFDTIFFSLGTQMSRLDPDPDRSVIKNKLASRIRIRILELELQLRGYRSERNIYGFATLMKEIIRYPQRKIR